VEVSYFEERGFYEAHEVLDGTFLLRLPRPTQLHADAMQKTGFHSVTSLFLRHFKATVFGRSNTHSSGAPPQLSRCSAL